MTDSHRRNNGGREAVLERSVKELGKLLSDVTHGGQFNHQIARALERARDALRRR